MNPARLHQLQHPRLVEPVRVGVRPAGQPQVAGERLGEDQRLPLSHQQAEHPAGPERPGHGRQRGGGVVDHLEDPVADHDVGLPLADQRGQLGGIALQPGDPSGQAGFGRPALQCGEGVGARVDHPDLMAARSQRNGHAARAAAEIDHVQRPPLAGDQVVELAGEQGEQMILRHRPPARQRCDRCSATVRA